MCNITFSLILTALIWIVWVSKKTLTNSQILVCHWKASLSWREQISSKMIPQSFHIPMISIILISLNSSNSSLLRCHLSMKLSLKHLFKINPWPSLKGKICFNRANSAWLSTLSPKILNLLKNVLIRLKNQWKNLQEHCLYLPNSLKKPGYQILTLNLWANRMIMMICQSLKILLKSLIRQRRIPSCVNQKFVSITIVSIAQFLLKKWKMLHSKMWDLFRPKRAKKLWKSLSKKPRKLWLVNSNAHIAQRHSLNTLSLADTNQRPTQASLKFTKEKCL